MAAAIIIHSLAGGHGGIDTATSHEKWKPMRLHNEAMGTSQPQLPQFYTGHFHPPMDIKKEVMALISLLTM